MPRLPSAEDFGARPVPEDQSPVVMDQAGPTVATALEGAARQTFATELNRVQAQNRFELATGRQQIITAQLAARQQLQDDPDWSTHVDRFTKAMDTAVGTIAGNANPRIRGMLQSFGAEQTQRGSLLVDEHAQQARHQQAVAGVLQNLDTMRQTALQAPDEASRSDTIKNASDMIDAAVQSGDIKPVEAQHLKQTWTQQYAHGAVSMLDDPGQVRMLSNPKGTPAEFLEPDRRAILLREAQQRVEAEERRREAEARQALAAKEADFYAAAYHGLPNAEALMPSKAEYRAADPKGWGARYQQATAALQFGNDITTMKTASPEQIASMRARYEVPTAAPGAAAALERQDAFDKAANFVLAQRKADPSKAAIEAGLWQPLDFSDPQKLADGLRHRVATAPDVSQQLGVNAPIVSKDERGALVTQLQALPPDKRLGALDQLRTATGSDPAYFGLMRTLMPTSPVTAIAGALIPSRNAPDQPVWFDPKHAVDPSVPKTILTGETILNAMGGDKAAQERSGFKGGYQMPDEKQLRQAFDDRAGDLFRGRPQLADAYYAAWRSYYAGAAAAKGKLSDTVDGTITEQASKDLFGQVTKVAGKAVAVPQGMSIDRFQGIADNALAVRMKAAGYDDAAIKAARGYGLTEATSDGLGAGRYYVELPNGRLSDRHGGALTIDLNAQYAPSAGARGGKEDRARAAARPQPPADTAEPPTTATSGPILGGRGPY